MTKPITLEKYPKAWGMYLLVDIFDQRRLVRSAGVRYEPFVRFGESAETHVKKVINNIVGASSGYSPCSFSEEIKQVKRKVSA